MANLLFKLNGVPDDEADEIRILLDEANIDFYETSPGNWGLSFAAIWVKNEAQFEPAKQLIEEYQKHRYQNAITERQTLIANGEQITLWQTLKSHPIRLIASIIFIFMILYLSIMPFFGRM